MWGAGEGSASQKLEKDGRRAPSPPPAKPSVGLSGNTWPPRVKGCKGAYLSVGFHWIMLVSLRGHVDLAGATSLDISEAQSASSSSVDFETPVEALNYLSLLIPPIHGFSATPLPPSFL